MIRIEFSYDSSGKLNGFTVNGHAGYDNAGKDIVCSAVSVLVINTINSIEAYCEDNFSMDQNEKEGYIHFYIENISESSELLLKSLRLGLESVIRSYGNDYVNIVS